MNVIMVWWHNDHHKSLMIKNFWYHVSVIEVGLVADGDSFLKESATNFIHLQQKFNFQDKKQ